jgi:hypothetical protein
MFWLARSSLSAYLVRVLDLHIFEGDGNEFALWRGPLNYSVLLDRANNILYSTYNGLLEVFATWPNGFEVPTPWVLVYLYIRLLSDVSWVDGSYISCQGWRCRKCE